MLAVYLYTLFALQMQDLAVLEEVIRMVLEIINSCLSANLHHNPNLVYTLLYQKESFAMFRSHPTFQDIIVNIDTVMAYFGAKLEHLGSSPSTTEVLEVIRQGSLQFRRDRLKVSFDWLNFLRLLVKYAIQIKKICVVFFF